MIIMLFIFQEFRLSHLCGTDCGKKITQNPRVTARPLGDYIIQVGEN